MRETAAIPGSNRASYDMGERERRIVIKCIEQVNGMLEMYFSPIYALRVTHV